jgi:polysaccharide export outer membrane protein/exopolysaccharide production protein ExoF
MVRACILVASLLLAGLRTDIVLAQETYRLGPSDRVRVNVTEWSTAGGEPRTRLNGEFTIASSGKLSLPLLGEIQAGGLTEDEIARAISEGIKARAGAVNAPVTSVEVTQYRPVYVLGTVERPGEYSFRPGMAVVHAFTLAGGPFRRTDIDVLRLSRDTVSARGDLRAFSASLDETTLRRARLQAELRDGTQVELPASLVSRKDEPAIAQALAREQENLKARRESFESELNASAEAKAMAESELQVLAAQLAGQNQRIGLLAKEAQEVRSLVAKGVANTARQLSADTALVDSEVRRSQIEAEIARAREKVGQEESEIRSLKAKRQADVLAELDTVEGRIRELTGSIATTQALLADSLTMAQQAGTPGGQREGTLSFSILREDQGTLRELVASEKTALRPGDVVTVNLVRESLGATAADARIR